MAPRNSASFSIFSIFSIFSMWPGNENYTFNFIFRWNDTPFIYIYISLSLCLSRSPTLLQHIEKICGASQKLMNASEHIWLLHKSVCIAVFKFHISISSFSLISKYIKNREMNVYYSMEYVKQIFVHAKASNIAQRASVGGNKWACRVCWTQEFSLYPKKNSKCVLLMAAVFCYN